ncbi:hypothetical protein J3Q64DRAFT_1732961 [Phycomyces blakesleeanus]|uniref:Uncharacterized protein n=1 Tax=Phycomyces blakesleeanus TaxID=4837 RepID=A0ABR3B486_PHYBL
MSPKESTNTNIFKTVPPQQSRLRKSLADQTFCSPKYAQLKAILDEALARAAIHKEQHKDLLSKIDVIVKHSIAFQEHNSTLTEELCIANEHVEFLHNQLQLQIQVPDASTFTTTTLLPTEIGPVEHFSVEASAHGPVTISTLSPTMFLAAAKKAMGKKLNQPKLSTAQATYTLILKIQQYCVLDIAFPKCSTLFLLVHNDFKDKITQLFADIGMSIIADLVHAHKHMQERQQLAYKLYCQCLLALCLRLPAPLGKSVMRHFCIVESSSLRLPPVGLEQYLEDRNLPSGPQASAIDTATAMVIG